MSDGLELFIRSAVAIATFFLILALCLRRPPTPGRRAFIFVGQEKFVMSKTIVQGSSHTATAVFTDANGVVRPLPAGVVPAWSVSDPASGVLTPAADGMTALLVAGSTDGDYTLTVTAEGDPAPGVDTLTGNFAFTVTDPEDTQVSITLS